MGAWGMGIKQSDAAMDLFGDLDDMLAADPTVNARDLFTTWLQQRSGYLTREEGIVYGAWLLEHQRVHEDPIGARNAMRLLAQRWATNVTDPDGVEWVSLENAQERKKVEKTLRGELKDELRRQQVIAAEYAVSEDREKRLWAASTILTPVETLRVLSEDSDAAVAQAAQITWLNVLSGSYRW